MLMAGCAFMDLVWSNLISRDDLARSNNITGVETCREMSRASFQTWLIFNPKGRQTYYLRSECFQQMAVRDRNDGYCNEVAERKSLYFNGTAISPEVCRDAVRTQMQKDLAERVRPEAIHRIEKVTVTPMSGGDTADVRISTAGALSGAYRLSLSLHDAEGRFLGPLATLETRLGAGPTDSLSVMIYRRDARRIAGPHYRAGERYLLTATLELLRDDAGQLARSGIKDADRFSAARESISFR
jgi:hypothetical protein